MAKMCDFSGSLTCPQCGYVAKKTATHRECRKPQSKTPVLMHFSLPTDPKFYGMPPWYFRWGDIAEKVLGSVGITKRRWLDFKAYAFKVIYGHPPKKKGCGCQARQDSMNAAGRRAWLRITDFVKPRLGRKLTG